MMFSYIRQAEKDLTTQGRAKLPVGKVNKVGTASRKIKRGSFVIFVSFVVERNYFT